MKKLSFIIVFVFLSILFVQAQQAKYVFYFIGDGMGVNQVLGTEMYRGELEGKIGVTPLLFTQFPYATIATTFSATGRYVLPVLFYSMDEYRSTRPNQSLPLKLHSGLSTLLAVALHAKPPNYFLPAPNVSS